MKKVISLLFVALMLCTLVLPVFAEDGKFVTDDGFLCERNYNTVAVYGYEGENTSVKLPVFDHAYMSYSPDIFKDRPVTEVTLPGSKDALSFHEEALASCYSVTRVNIEKGFKANISICDLLKYLDALTDIYFDGTEREWKKLKVDYSDTTSAFARATLHFADGSSRPVNPYTDIIKGKWYVSHVNNAIANNAMIGTSETTFSPDAYMTREQAMVWLLGTKEHFDSYSFSDVVPGSYYADAVEYAYRKGYTAGIGGGKFGVGMPITREQFFTMIYKICYEKTYEENQLVPDADFHIYVDDAYKNFKDLDSVAPYAMNAIKFLAGWYSTSYRSDMPYSIDLPHRLVYGWNGYVMPKKYLTRAEVAVFVPLPHVG